MPPALDKPDTSPQLSSSSEPMPQVTVRQKFREDILSGGAEVNEHNRVENLVPAGGAFPPVGKENSRQPISTPSQYPPQIPPTMKNSNYGPNMQSTGAASRPETPVPPPVSVAFRPADKKARSEISPVANGPQPTTHQSASNEPHRHETPITSPVPVATRLPPQLAVSQSPPATQNSPKKVPSPSPTSGKRIASQYLPLSGHAEKKQKTASATHSTATEKPTNASKTRQTSPTPNPRPETRNSGQHVAPHMAYTLQPGSFPFATPSMPATAQQPMLASTNSAPVFGSTLEEEVFKGLLNPRIEDAYMQKFDRSQPTARVSVNQNSTATTLPQDISGSIQQVISAQTVQHQQQTVLHSAEHDSRPPGSSAAPSSHPFPTASHSYASSEVHLPPQNHDLAQAGMLHSAQQNIPASARQGAALHTVNASPSGSSSMSYAPRIPVNIPSQSTSASHHFLNQGALPTNNNQLASGYVPSPLSQFQKPSLSRDIPQRQLQSLSFQGAPTEQPGARAFPDSVTRHSRFQDALRLRKSRDAAQNSPAQSQRRSQGIFRLGLQPISPQNIPQQQKHAGSPPTIPSARPKDIQTQPNQSRPASRPAPLAGLSKRLIWDARHFLLYFGKYIGYPNIFLPRTDIDQCVNNILEILSNYHAIEKILQPDGWELAQVHREGYRFGSAVFKVSLDLPGYNNVSNMIPHVAKYFQDQEQAAEKQIQEMGSEMLDEFNVYGRASWYYAQQMERVFFSQAKLGVIDLSRREIEEQREAAAVEVQKEVRQEGLNKRYEGVWYGNNRQTVSGEMPATEKNLDMTILPGDAVESRNEFTVGGLNGPVDMNVPLGMGTLPGGIIVSREEVMTVAGVRPVPNTPIHSSPLAIPPGFRAPSPSEHIRHFGDPMLDPRLQGQTVQAAPTPSNSGKPTPARCSSPDYDPLMEGIVEGLIPAVNADAEAAVME